MGDPIVRACWEGFGLTNSDEVVLPCELLQQVNPEQTDLLLDNFDNVFPIVEKALSKSVPLDTLSYRCGDVTKARKPHLHITGINKLYEGGIAAFLGQSGRWAGVMQPITGYVRRVSPVVQDPQMLVWQCARCLQYVTEPNGKQPLECYRDQGGCGKSAASTRFNMIPAPIMGLTKPGTSVNIASEFRNYQEVTLQDIPGTALSIRPVVLKCRLYDENCFRAQPGDIVTVNGTLKTELDLKRKISEHYFDVNSIEIQPRGSEDIKLTDEDMEKIMAMSKDPDIVANLIASLAPSIDGLDDVKEGIVLQLFGGRDIDLGRTQERGTLNILLVGEPGVAKSQLLRSAAATALKSARATGNTSSKVGLTAAVIKEESFGATAYSVEAGAVVLASGGIAVLDEVEKAEPEDIEGLHEAMEQGQVTLNKAGISMTLEAKTSILAAANPRDGKFDPNDAIMSQIDLTPTLISRFDLIFIIYRPKGQEKSRKLAEFMRKRRRGEVVEPIIDTETFRKYVAYAKRVKPILTEAVGKPLDDFYCRMVAMGESNDTLTITPRQMESLQRLAEASARMRLSEAVEEQDVARAIRIMEQSLSQYASADGVPDYSKVVGDVSKSQRNRLEQIVEAVSEFGGNGVPIDDLVARFHNSLPREHVEKDVARLKHEHRLLCLPNGNLKVFDKPRRD